MDSTNAADNPPKNVKPPWWFKRLKLRWKLVAIYWAVFLVAGVLFLLLPSTGTCTRLFCGPYAFLLIGIVSYPGILIADLALGILNVGSVFGIDAGAIELTGFTIFSTLFYYAVGLVIEIKRAQTEEYPGQYKNAIKIWNAFLWFGSPFLLGFAVNGLLTVIPVYVADAHFPAEAYVTGGILDILKSSVPYLTIDAILLILLLWRLGKGVSKKLILASVVCNVIGFYFLVVLLPRIFCLFENCV